MFGQPAPVLLAATRVLILQFFQGSGKCFWILTTHRRCHLQQLLMSLFSMQRPPGHSHLLLQAEHHTLCPVPQAIRLSILT